MKALKILGIMVVIGLLLVGCVGCMEGSQSEKNDRSTVTKQQLHYQKVQPIPFFDYSIPRDVVIQIYQVVATEARNTYTVIESITGEVRFAGPSIGYGIPADTQLTNALQPAGYEDNATIEQAEPNGLFSSKNTDGTWVLFVDRDGQVTPIYTEMKVTTYPFVVTRNTNGEWVRADNAPASFTVDLSKKKK